MCREGKQSVSRDIIILPWQEEQEEEEEGGGDDGDVIMRSYLVHLPPLGDIMAHLLTRAVMGGHVGAPQDTDGVIMLCQQ